MKLKWKARAECENVNEHLDHLTCPIFCDFHMPTWIFTHSRVKNEFTQLMSFKKNTQSIIFRLRVSQRFYKYLRSTIYHEQCWYWFRSRRDSRFPGKTSIHFRYTPRSAWQFPEPYFCYHSRYTNNSNWKSAFGSHHL